MLQRIRDGLQSQKWLTYVVIGALILVFAAWGAYGIVDLSIGAGNYAATAERRKDQYQGRQRCSGSASRRCGSSASAASCRRS